PPQPPRLTWRRVPRMALAGGALALTAILAAALLVVPRSQVGPAASGQWSYPADHALTSPELALLMAGPALPTNTALVANAVIDIRSDVCPMNRYPTVGIVEGMGSQVCVMAADLSAVPPGHTANGTFAFRYLAPGYLGLLGEITPASSAMEAFRVVDEWPLAGKTFLVEGWLGAEGLVYPCASLAPAWDVLSPNGEDCPNDNWLSDDPSAPLIDTSVAVGPQSTRDATKLYGNARIVEAGGMRQIDSIDHGTPVRGVYVVRSVTEQCPGAEPQDSQGCATWRVLAKVAEVSVPPPRGTPVEAATAAPTTAPPATPLVPALTGFIGTGNQPLTADELETLMVNRPDHLAGRIVIIEAPIPTQISCQSDANGGGCAVNTKPLAQTGIWAVSIVAEGALRLVGQITTPGGRLVVTVGDTNVAPSAPIDEFLIVDGWLDWGAGYECDATPRPTSAYCDTPGLGPYLIGMPGVTAFRELVQSAAFQTFGSENLNAGPVQGLYLVHLCTSCGRDEILARLEPAVLS
ncbi:MAG TPA: hypothetical protein VF371_04770, partial [Candidatus Limnocylindrales bacterium]